MEQDLKSKDEVLLWMIDNQITRRNLSSGNKIILAQRKAPIKIDEEFKNLIPPLTPDEYKGLEESILKEGCRDSLVTWNDILIDGHNRYEICVKHGIAFQTTEHEFENRQSVIEWIILNQFSRRNITAFQRSELALKLKPVIAEKAKEQHGIRNDIPQISAESFKPIETRQEIAKAAGVSHDTIAKVEKIKETAPEPIIQATRQNDISINSAYQVTKLEPEEQQEIAERIENIKNEPKETNTPKAIVQEVRKQKLEEAQAISEAVLDAEVRIGELMAQIPKVRINNPTGKNQHTGQNDTVVDLSKSENFKNDSGVDFDFRVKENVPLTEGIQKKFSGNMSISGRSAVELRKFHTKQRRSKRNFTLKVLKMRCMTFSAFKGIAISIQ